MSYRRFQNSGGGVRRDRHGVVLLSRCIFWIRRTTAGCGWAGRWGAAFRAGQAGAGDFSGVFRHVAGARHQQPRHTLAAGGAGRRAVDLLRWWCPTWARRWCWALTAAVVFFVAGLEWRYCAIAAAVALVGRGAFHCGMEPYRLARVVKFFDPDFKTSSAHRSAGPDQGADGKSLVHPRHQLPVGTIPDRRGRGRAVGRRTDERPPEAAVPAGSAYRFHLRGGGRGDAAWSVRWGC